MYDLLVDSEFYMLSVKTGAEKHKTLEASLLDAGCIEPLAVWKGIILDGHKRYELCCQHRISYNVVQISALSREEAIVLACNNHIKHPCISEEMRRYLIGKIYIAGKTLMARNCISAIPDFSIPIDKLSPHTRSSNNKPSALRRHLSQKYHISRATVIKYEKYAHAIDVLSATIPDIANDILCGQVKLSQENTALMAQFTHEDMREFSKRLYLHNGSLRRYSQTREALQLQDKRSDAMTHDLSPSSQNLIIPDGDLFSQLIHELPLWIGTIRNFERRMSSLMISPKNASLLEKDLIELRLAVNVFIAKIGKYR